MNQGRKRRLIVHLVVATLAGVVGTAAMATPDPGLVGVPLRMTAVSSGLCVDVVGGPANQANGSAVQQYTCMPRDQYNQVFKLVQLGTTGAYSVVVQSTATSAGSSCLDVPSNLGGNGTGVQLWTCGFSSGSPQQLWNVNKTGSVWNLVNIKFGRCLDVRGGPGATNPGAIIQVWDCSGATNQQFNLTPQAYPTLGILYQSWFNDNPADPSSPCDGSGWTGSVQNGTHLGPFKVNYDTPGHVVVQSVTAAGPCYSSTDPNAATQHGNLLGQMGVSFVVLDDTNLGKTTPPASNPIYNASKNVTTGLSSSTPVLRAAYMLSLTCWQQICYSGQSLPSGGTGTTEMGIWNNADIGAEVTDIATRYSQTPSQFYIVNGKPLLVLYVNQGSDVYCPQSPPADLRATGLCPNSTYNQLTQAFGGAIVPSQAQFNPPITVNGVQSHLYDLFTVRFGVVASTGFDYSPYGSQIWPMYCASNCTGSEAGYVSNVRGSGARAWANATQYINEALAANNQSDQYVLINGWNEFSSTDEYQNHAWTLEPNNYLGTVPGDEANGDPWYFFNQYKNAFYKWH